MNIEGDVLTDVVVRAREWVPLAERREHIQDVGKAIDAPEGDQVGVRDYCKSASLARSLRVSKEIESDARRLARLWLFRGTRSLVKDGMVRCCRGNSPSASPYLDIENSYLGEWATAAAAAYAVGAMGSLS